VPAQLPVAQEVLSLAGEPHLVGSRCTECSLVMVPSLEICIRCGSASQDRIDLPRTGVLWTWTTQEFMPPRPPYGADVTRETFTPFLVGYVEFENLGRLETQLVDVDADSIRIGTVMELTVIPFSADADGNQRMTFAFRPKTD
jgi:uncharacterized OB-fold protein